MENKKKWPFKIFSFSKEDKHLRIDLTTISDLSMIGLGLYFVISPEKVKDWTIIALGVLFICEYAVKSYDNLFGKD